MSKEAIKCRMQAVLPFAVRKHPGNFQLGKSLSQGIGGSEQTAPTLMHKSTHYEVVKMYKPVDSGSITKIKHAFYSKFKAMEIKLGRRGKSADNLLSSPFYDHTKLK